MYSNFCIGTHQIALNLLQEPPDFLRVREIKEWYVDYLYDLMKTEEGDHEDLTAPLLVQVSVKKVEFKLRDIGKYKYMVNLCV